MILPSLSLEVQVLGAVIPMVGHKPQVVEAEVEKMVVHLVTTMIVVLVQA
jgi:hypothetical protein